MKGIILYSTAKYYKNELYYNELIIISEQKKECYFRANIQIVHKRVYLSKNAVMWVHIILVSWETNPLRIFKVFSKNCVQK